MIKMEENKLNKDLKNVEDFKESMMILAQKNQL